MSPEILSSITPLGEKVIFLSSLEFLLFTRFGMFHKYQNSVSHYIFIDI